MWGLVAAAWAAGGPELPKAAPFGTVGAAALDPCPVSVSIDARGRPQVGALVGCDPAWAPVAARLVDGRWSPGEPRDVWFSLALGPGGRVVPVARVEAVPVARVTWAERLPDPAGVTVVPWVGVPGPGVRTVDGEPAGAHRVGVALDAAAAVVFVAATALPETRIASFDAPIVPDSAWRLGARVPAAMVDPPDAMVACAVRISQDSDLTASAVADCPSPWAERVAGWFRAPDPVAGRYAPPARGCVQVWLGADGTVETSACPADDARARFQPAAPITPAPIGAVLGGADLSCLVVGNVGPDGIPTEVSARGCDAAAASAAVEAVVASRWQGRSLVGGPFALGVEVPARQVIGPRSAPELAFADLRVVRQVEPEFPSMYADTSTSRCTVRARVATDGTVADAAITGCPEGFAAATDAAVRGWRFAPSEGPFVTQFSLFFAGARAKR